MATARDRERRERSVFNGERALVEDCDLTLAAMAEGRAGAGCGAATSPSARRFVLEGDPKPTRWRAARSTAKGAYGIVRLRPQAPRKDGDRQRREDCLARTIPSATSAASSPTPQSSDELRLRKKWTPTK